MRLTGQEDLRVQKTIEAISSTFQQLLMEKDYAHITVKELCERARINKKTFYRYYPTLDDLLAEFQETYSAPYVEQTKGLRFPQDVEAITRAFLTYSAAQGELYDRITCNDSHRAIRDRMIDEVYDSRMGDEVAPEGWDAAEWSIYLAFVTSAPLNIYQRWVADGRRLSVARMVDLGCELVCRGAEGLTPSTGGTSTN